MSEKKHQKSIEELCRSRLSRTAGGEMWPLPQTSSHRLFRSPSPRESFSRSRRRSENTRHSLLVSRPLSTDIIPGGSSQNSAHDAEKRMFFQGSHEPIKKPFLPDIPPQSVTHADPPFPGTDTQPLPPINIPKSQEYPCASKHGKDNRPFTIFGQIPFEGGVAYDIIFGANEERAGKRKLEAIKWPEDQERQDWCVPRQHKAEKEYLGKKKCGGKKKGRRARKFPKPLAWKSPWPEQDGQDDSDADWIDIN